MITRIEINGFKSFHDFKVNFRPFQVFIGPNGVGKTNLFDAIVLLSNLAGNNTVKEAFRQSRGEIAELFTYFPDGTRAKKMTFAVEMLVARTITSDSGKTLEVPATRLRYELDLEHQIENDVDQVYVLRESLVSIPDGQDTWVKDNIPTRTRKNWVVRERRPPYIATDQDKDKTVIHRNSDSPGGGRETFTVGQLDRTAISSSDVLRFPTASAAKQEMLSWRFLQLNPVALRARSSAQSAATLLPDGSNLAAVLARIGKDSPTVLPKIVADMTKIIPDIRNLSVKTTPDQPEYLVEVETQDNGRFSSRVLSDGTLRLLALVTLKNDPRHQGAVCFEEPENGVQPFRLKQIVDVLTSLATNLDDQNASGALRQVLINTHSPALLASVPADSMFYVSMKLHEHGRETRIVPVRPMLLGDDSEAYYTWEQVKLYLDSAPLNKKLEELGL